MRCLGRIFLAIILILLLAAGWLYRTEISRYVRGVVDPMSVARRTGTPSPEAKVRAERKLISLSTDRPDSVVLAADELASLVVSGTEILGIRGVDSISIELGDRRIRTRAMIETAELPARFRSLIPGNLRAWEEIVAEGELAPARPGMAEWNLERVIVRGLPLPADLVARIVNQATGTATDGRLRVTLPAGMSGFRVRPEGVAIYRSGP
jgi:hypothetical protein